jgi:hypothetical protein
VRSRFLVGASRVRFTKHAVEKFEILRRYGLEIEEKQVIEAVLRPERLDEKGDQFFANRVMSPKHALRVVYENRKDFLVVITFYPVRRERYDL